MADIPKAVKEYMAEIGKKGGSVRSEAKKKASRRNATKYKTDAQRKKARAEANRKYYENRQKAKKAAAKNGNGKWIVTLITGKETTITAPNLAAAKEKAFKKRGGFKSIRAAE